MKKLIGFLAIVVMVLITPYFIGQNVETKVRAIYSQLDQNPGFDIVISDYHRGWFSSTAKATLTVPIVEDGSSLMPSLTFTIKQTMQHGPVLLQTAGLGFGLTDINYDISLPSELSQQMPNEIATIKDALHINARMAFNGDLHTKTRLNDFQLAIDNSQVNVKSANFDSTITMAGEITVDGSWQGLTIVEDEQTVVEIAGMSINSKQQLIRGELFSPMALSIGDMKVTIASFKVNGPTPGNNFVVNNINMSGAVQEHNQLLAIDMQFNAENISAAGQDYTDFNYHAVLDNLDIEVFQQIQTTLLKLQQLSEQQQMVAMMDLQALLPKLLDKGPTLKIEQLGVNTSDGAIKTKMTVMFDSNNLDPNNPMSMILALDADAQGHAPEAALQHFGIGTHLEELISQKVLIRGENNLSFKFTFKNGTALLNGTAIPLG